MRILLINDFVEEIGGIEVICSKIKPLLEGKGHEVMLIGGHYEQNSIKRFINGFFNFKLYNVIKKAANDYQPDIIHIHSMYFIFPYFLYSLKRLNVPIIITIHGFSHSICPQLWMMYRMKMPCVYGFDMRCLLHRCHPKINIFYRVILWIKLYMLRRTQKETANLFISPSKSLAEWIERSLDINNVLVLPNFWNLKDDSTGRFVADGTKDILYVGRLGREKGIDYLIKSLPSVTGLHPEARLIIVGDGPMDKDLKALVSRLSIDDKVIFRRYINHDDLAKLYSQSFIFVAPSLCMESFGITIIEAMSQGIPVITTSIGAQAELVNEGVNGYLVNPGDVGDLTNKICAFFDMNPSTYKAMCAEAKRFSERFTADAHIDSLDKIYKEISILTDSR